MRKFFCGTHVRGNLFFAFGRISTLHEKERKFWQSKQKKKKSYGDVKKKTFIWFYIGFTTQLS